MRAHFLFLRSLYSVLGKSLRIALKSDTFTTSMSMRKHPIVKTRASPLLSFRWRRELAESSSSPWSRMSFFNWSRMYSSVQNPVGPMKVKPFGRLANSSEFLLCFVLLRPGFFLSFLMRKEDSLSGMASWAKDFSDSLLLVCVWKSVDR